MLMKLALIGAAAIIGLFIEINIAINLIGNEMQKMDPNKLYCIKFPADLCFSKRPR